MQKVMQSVAAAGGAFHSAKKGLCLVRTTEKYVIDI